VDTAVISDALKAQIDGRTVLAGVFTTYTFDPEFFELDVIPLLLDESVPYSSDDRVKQFQVREHLREAGLPLEVFYDLPVNRDGLERSPAMDYLCHGVNYGNAAFHGKLVLLLLHDEAEQQDCLLVGLGSNNLSRSGWWDNIECQHWETVWNGEVFRGFRDRLVDDINFLKDRRPGFAGRGPSALDRIAEFLEDCRASLDAEPVHYYCLSHVEYRTHFTAFLRSQKQPVARYHNWNLEIISPFFADDETNTEHTTF